MSTAAHDIHHLTWLQPDLPGRQEMPNGGILRINRRMPFIIVAFSEGRSEEEQLAKLVASQANFVLGPDDATTRDVISYVCGRLRDRFGCMLVVQLWIGDLDPEETNPIRPQPSFKIISTDDEQLVSTVDEFGRACKEVSLYKKLADISFDCVKQPSPPTTDPLDLSPPIWQIGIEVAPSYRNQATGQLHPIEFEDLRQQTSYAIKQGAFHFCRTCSSWQPRHYFALGRGDLGKQAQVIDEELSDIHSSFNFLLQTSPVNAKEAWTTFQKDDFSIEPVFHYRPLAVDPEKLKRRLFDLPVEKVDDPVLVRIFREKQEELDRKLTMLREIDSRAFFLGSIQLYGEVKPEVLNLAESLLERLPANGSSYDSEQNISDQTFADLACKEFDYYREQYGSFPKRPEIRNDIPPGLMVSRGMLLIGEGTRIAPNRVEALLEHEVGTHMVTYFNGSEQRLKLLHSGLAGYEALQEGIAVVGEHLAGGLTVTRLRTLAARVIAADALIDEASFIEVFQTLTDGYAFEPEKAFTICRRTFRGGGFIKDVIYLRGLREVIGYLREGGDFRKLFIGKLAIHHLPFIQELDARDMLNESPLTPRMITRNDSEERLKRIREGLTIVDLVT